MSPRLYLALVVLCDVPLSERMLLCVVSLVSMADEIVQLKMILEMSMALLEV